MTTIKMLKTRQGSPDGFTVNTYIEGETYEVSESLANAFINDDKVAEPVSYEAEQPAEKAVKPQKNKAEQPAENKAS